MKYFALHLSITILLLASSGTLLSYGQSGHEHQYANGFCTECGVYEAAVFNTSDQYYEISNAGQYFWFCLFVNSGNLTANARLISDIVINSDLLGADGMPKNGSRQAVIIAPTSSPSASAGYNGTFDGNGHRIDGLYIDETSAYSGMFGCLGSKGTVKDLTLSGFVRNTASTTAAFAGESFGQIRNCVNECRIVGAGNAGGFCGLLWGETKNAGGMIENCTNRGDISGASNVGGICGGCYTPAAGSITRCINHGNISSTGSYVGGIAGNIVNGSNTTVIYCGNTGNLTVSGTGTDIGGVVGTTSKVDDHVALWNEGNVYAPNCTNVGGVVGNLNSTKTSANAMDYPRLYSGYNTGNVTGKTCVGGIVGNAKSYSAIAYTYSCGLVSGTTNVSYICYQYRYINTGTFSKTNYVWQRSPGVSVGNAEHTEILEDDTLLANGEVCYKLTQMLPHEPKYIPFTQILGAESHPTLLARDGGIVYEVLNCKSDEVAGYSNDPAAERMHTYGEEHYCIRCGTEETEMHGYFTFHPWTEIDEGHSTNHVARSSDGLGWRANHIMVDDGRDYMLEEDVEADCITYHRDISEADITASNWQSICVPFYVPCTEWTKFADGVYKFTGIEYRNDVGAPNAKDLEFTLISPYWEPIVPHTPYLFKPKGNIEVQIGGETRMAPHRVEAEDGEDGEDEEEVTMPKTYVLFGVPATDMPVQHFSRANTYSLKGIYSANAAREADDSANYVLGTEGFSKADVGTSYQPFRTVLNVEGPDASTQNSFGIRVNEPMYTAVSDVNAEQMASDNTYYTLTGIPVNPHHLLPGLYLHRGKKILVR